MRPLSVVDSDEFKKLLNIMDPKYRLPCRKHFAEKIIPDMYSEAVDALKLKLGEASSVSLTTDGWTSRACQSYMTVTAHYTSSNWEIKNYVLSTRMLAESHTGENIGNALKEVIEEWKLERPMGTAVVSDNASNMDIAAKTADLVPHIKCFAHTVNLASQRGLKVTSMARLLGRIRRVVGFFHKSTTATAVLRAKQTLLALPQHKLINDVATRWNSSYEMIDRFLEQQPAILSTLTSTEVKRNVKDIITLTADDINEAHSAVEVLTPLKTITAIMCDEHIPTVSLIYPLKAQIMDSMTEKVDDSTLIKEVKAAIKQDISKRYNSTEIDEFLLVCSALDPRFRTLPQLDAQKRDHVFDCVAVKVVSSADTVYVKPAPAVGGAPDVGGATGTGDGPPFLRPPPLPELPGLPPLPELPGLPPLPELPLPHLPTNIEDGPTPAKVPAKCAMEDLFGDVYVVSSTPGLPTAPRVAEEIRRYRLEPNIPLRNNPLEWWKVNAAEYPLLSRLAQSVLSIPGTSVPSERVFSAAGDIVSATRSCLDPDLVDKLIFLKKNMKRI